MIKIEKLAEPNVLQTQKAQWTDDYKNAKASNADNIDELKHRYRHPEIKEQIVRETHGKCAYCESKIRHTYPGDVEHMKPKVEFDDEIFEYANLTLACGECNRRKSSNYDSDIGIINPYEDDPELHLIAHGPLIFPKPGDLKGKLAHELLELNRIDLFERRKDQLEQMQLQMDLFASTSNELLKKLYKRNLDRNKEASTEYAMIKRAFIKRTLASLRH